MRQASSGLVLGPVLLRVGAFIIDWIAVLLVFLAVAALGGIELDGGRPRDALGFAAVIVTMATYHCLFLAWQSATPGKLMLNIYVAYPDGKPLGPDTAILRSTALITEILLAVLHPIGLIVPLGSLLLMAIDRDRRAIHDRVAGTIVLAGRAGAPLRVEDEPPVDL